MRRGFTLVEVLIVIGVIVILIGLVLPVLSGAHAAADRALCANNEHQLAMASRLYATDFHNYLGQAGALDYRTASDPNNGRDLPESFIKSGFTNPLTRHADHYLVLNYLPLTTNKLGLPGNNILLCPAARRNLSTLSDHYWGDTGNATCDYFISSLLTRPTNPDVRARPRDNIHGPYKANQIIRPDDTFLAGDAMCYTDPPPGDTSDESNAQVAMVDRFDWTQVGEQSTVFGVTTTSHGKWLSEPPPYHSGGPNGLYFDGHVKTISPPPADHRFELRSNFTASFTGQHT